MEIDHTRSDIIIVDEEDNLPLGRLTFTYCLDIATRYPLGYYLGFEPPSYLTVMECLHHAILPKGDVKETYGTEHDWIAYGVPATLIVDNGKEFIGRDLQDACNSLGIVLQLLPVKTPHFKATVERMFGTLNTGLLHTLPGTTFSNTFQRGDYDSLRFATLTLDELDKLIHTFLLGVYAESFHKGLGAVPARRWEAALEDGFFPRVPGNPEDLIILLGRVTHRVIRPSGIQFHSLRYNCPELAPLRARMEKQKEQQVKVKYHPGDLSQLHVYDPFDERYIEVPALAQDYTRGLSLWKHEVIRNFVLRQQDRVNIASLAHNKRKIQEIVEESKKRKKLKTRSRVARWDHAGKTLPSQPADKTVPSQTEHATLPLPQIDLNIDPDKLEEDGWGISHNLPVSMRRNAQ